LRRATEVGRAVERRPDYLGGDHTVVGPGATGRAPMWRRLAWDARPVRGRCASVDSRGAADHATRPRVVSVEREQRGRSFGGVDRDGGRQLGFVLEVRLRRLGDHGLAVTKLQAILAGEDLELALQRGGRRRLTAAAAGMCRARLPRPYPPSATSSRPLNRYGSRISSRTWQVFHARRGQPSCRGSCRAMMGWQPRLGASRTACLGERSGQS
jgi:hypothetical protein